MSENQPEHRSESRKSDWLTDRLKYLRALKAPSAHQRLLLLLAEKPNRSADEDRKLAVLVRAEKADERVRKARTDVAKLLDAEKTAARKARNHRLIQQGLLFDLAGLEHRGRDELLGALLALAKTDDPTRWEHWQAAGKALLAQKSDTAGKSDSTAELA